MLRWRWQSVLLFFSCLFFFKPQTHSRKSKRRGWEVGHKQIKLLATMVTTALIVLPCGFFLNVFFWVTSNCPVRLEMIYVGGLVCLSPLIGRLNCIKMNVQPRLQYLFRPLPMPLPISFFKTLNRYVRQFIWNGKVPRISMGKLPWDYGSGGLWLSSFKSTIGSSNEVDLILFWGQWRPFLDTNRTAPPERKSSMVTSCTSILLEL